MARPRTYKTQGVVLKHMPLGEADRLLTLIAPDRGKVRAVARGVRRTKSKKAGHLEPLTHVTVSIAEGRGLDVIAEVETVHSFRGIREDLRRVSTGLYLAELVDNFSSEQSPSPAVFHLLVDALGWLQNAEDGTLLLRYFEVRLLANAGFGPELYQCVECSSDLEPADHLFSTGKGGVLCPECRTQPGEAMLPLSLGAMKVVRFLRREPYPRVAELEVPAPLLEEIERLLRSYIRYVLERDLKSTEFMDLVRSDKLQKVPR